MTIPSEKAPCRLETGRHTSIKQNAIGEDPHRYTNTQKCPVIPVPCVSGISGRGETGSYEGWGVSDFYPESADGFYLNVAGIKILLLSLTPV